MGEGDGNFGEKKPLIILPPWNQRVFFDPRNPRASPRKPVWGKFGDPQFFSEITSIGHRVVLKTPISGVHNVTGGYKEERTLGGDSRLSGYPQPQGVKSRRECGRKIFLKNR